MYVANIQSIPYLCHGVHEGLEVGAGVGGGEELHPEVERVDELPVVHRLDRLLLLQRDGVAKRDAELPHVDKGVVVAGLGVEGEQLGEGAPHEIDEGPRAGTAGGRVVSCSTMS